MSGASYNVLLRLEAQDRAALSACLNALVFMQSCSMGGEQGHDDPLVRGALEQAFAALDVREELPPRLGEAVDLLRRVAPFLSVPIERKAEFEEIRGRVSGLLAAMPDFFLDREDTEQEHK